MDYIVKEQDLTNIANAIRNKTGQNSKYKVNEMSSAIKNIQSILVDYGDYSNITHTIWQSPSQPTEICSINLEPNVSLILVLAESNSFMNESYLATSIYGTISLPNNNNENGAWTSGYDAKIHGGKSNISITGQQASITAYTVKARANFVPCTWVPNIKYHVYQFIK